MSASRPTWRCRPTTYRRFRASNLGAAHLHRGRHSAWIIWEPIPTLWQGHLRSESLPHRRVHDPAVVSIGYQDAPIRSNIGTLRRSNVHAHGNRGLDPFNRRWVPRRGHKCRDRFGKQAHGDSDSWYPLSILTACFQPTRRMSRFVQFPRTSLGKRSPSSNHGSCRRPELY